MEEEFEELKEEDILFSRDDKGDLVPIWINVPTLKKKIYAIPLAEGEVSRLITSVASEEDKDAKIIEEKVLKPKLKYDDLVKAGNSQVIKEVVMAILKISGFKMGGGSIRNNFPSTKTIKK